jgi:hypothetical protein
MLPALIVITQRGRALIVDIWSSGGVRDSAIRECGTSARLVLELNDTPAGYEPRRSVTK